MKKILSLFLILLLLLSGQTAWAAKKDTSFQSLHPAAQEKGKLSKEAKAQKGKAGIQEYLIEFKSSLEPDEIPVPKTPGASSLIRKQAKGKAVISTLKAQAEKSQGRFAEKFKKEKVSHKSFYIANMMWVKTDYAKIEELAKDPQIKKIYLNQTIRLEPVKSAGSAQAVPAEILWNVKKVQADQVWAQGVTGKGTVVGIIDSGVDWSHPALKNSFRANAPDSTSAPDPALLPFSWYDSINYRSQPYDDEGHGTHVTGTIVGQTASAAIGVAPGASWIAAKALDSSGSGSGYTLLDAGQWMLAPGGDPAMAPDIINNSWGGGDNVDEWYRNMVKAWRSAGIVPVFAAGNQLPDEASLWPGSISNPSSYPESSAVAAIDSGNALAYFSRLGPSPYDAQIRKPDLSAPGVSIYSAAPGGSYSYGSGTSMAAPHLAGAAALVLSANPALSVDEVLFALQQSALPLTNTAYPSSPNMGFGYGLISARAAVELSRDGFTKTSLTGKVTDYTSGAPVPGAQVRVLEHPSMTPVRTDDDGTYRISGIPSGRYTLEVYHPRYGHTKQSVTAQAVSFNTFNVRARYLGPVHNQLTYDDGTAEDATVFTYSGSGFGVAFRPERYGLIRSVSGYFWGNDYPANTGTAMNLALYKADRNLVPTTELLLAPFKVQVKRGAWATFDLSAYGLRTDQPFVAVFTQVYGDSASPAMGRDTDSLTGTNHSYFYFNDGSVDPLEIEYPTGSWMIRAGMDYSLADPIITGVKPGTQKDGIYYTSGVEATVSGTAAGAKTVGIWQNGSMIGESAVSGGAFSAPLSLDEGANAVRAALLTEGAPSVYSKEIHIVQDSVSPVLQITSPAPGTVETRSVTVSGNVKEANLAALTINGTAVTSDPDGNFSSSVTLKTGRNAIVVQAADRAGHSAETTVEVTCLYEPPAPAAPSSLTAAAASHDSVTLAWSPAPEVAGYSIYRAASSSGTYRYIGTTDAMSFTDTGLTAGTTYYYKIQSYVTDGTGKAYSAFTAPVSAGPLMLSAPTALKASPAGSSVALTWGSVPGAAGYSVYRASSSTGTFSLIGSSTTAAYSSTGLTTSSTYYYKIRAYAMNGTTKVYGPYTAVVSAKPALTVPASLTAASSGYSSIALSWRAVSGATGYNVYRATSSAGTYSYIGTTTTTSYKNTGRTTGTTYYYKVRAYRTAGTSKVYSSYSGIVSAKPTLSVPGSFTARRSTSSSIKTAWTSVSGASGYEVWRAASSTGTYYLRTSRTTLSYTNTSLTTGKTYYYKVRAYRMAGTKKIYSAWSPVKSARP